MAKFITKKDLKGITFNQDIEWLLSEINQKGDINGRYFSAWWFDIRHSQEDTKAMSEIIYTLTINWMKEHHSLYNQGVNGSCRLREVAAYVGDKLNVWNGTVIAWYRSMYHMGYQNVIVDDHCGLDSLTVLNVNRK